MAKETKNIYQKLLEFQSEGLTFEKTADNPFFKSKYTPLDDLNVKIKPVLSNLGLFIYHTVTEGKVVTTIVNTDNVDETITCTMELPELTDPQKLGSAITYFKRYNTVALLNLDSETDGDGNHSKPEKVKFGKKAMEAFKESLVSEKFQLPETKEELYEKMEKKYILSKEVKEELAKLYIINDNTNEGIKNN